MKSLGHANAADPKGHADSQPPNAGGKARYGQRAKSGGCCLWCSRSLTRAGLTLLPWALLGTERGCAGGWGRCMAMAGAVVGWAVRAGAGMELPGAWGMQYVREQDSARIPALSLLSPCFEEADGTSAVCI